MYWILIMVFVQECGVWSSVIVSRSVGVFRRSKHGVGRRRWLESVLRSSAAHSMAAYKQQMKQFTAWYVSQIGPVHTEEYAPNRGYEPYWVGGDWLLHEQDKNKSEGLCGAVCSTVYKRYGRICGRDKYNNYQTFPDYCAMKSIDCDDKDKWLIAYRGPCTEPYLLKTHPTRSFTLQDRARSLMAHYFVNIQRSTVCSDPNPYNCLGGLPAHPMAPEPPVTPPNRG